MVENDARPTVLVTGAGIGIGAATVRAFAGAGYRVTVTDVLDGEGGGVVSGSGEAEYHRLDLTSTEQADVVVGDVQRRYGPLDAVVANAGIAHRVPLTELSDERWDQTHEIDLKGAMHVCRAAAPVMREVGRGSVVAVSSIMDVAYGWDEHVQYSAAKAGVVGLLRGLAVELAGDGVCASTASPPAT